MRLQQAQPSLSLTLIVNILYIPFYGHHFGLGHVACSKDTGSAPTLPSFGIRQVSFGRTPQGEVILGKSHCKVALRINKSFHFHCSCGFLCTNCRGEHQGGASHYGSRGRLNHPMSSTGCKQGGRKDTRRLHLKTTTKGYYSGQTQNTNEYLHLESNHGEAVVCISHTGSHPSCRLKCDGRMGGDVRWMRLKPSFTGWPTWYGYCTSDTGMLQSFLLMVASLSSTSSDRRPLGTL